MARARSTTDAAIDRRRKELLKPALEEYNDDKIDGVELDQRKKAAREQAGPRLPPT